MDDNILGGFVGVTAAITFLLCSYMLFEHYTIRLIIFGSKFDQSEIEMNSFCTTGIGVRLILNFGTNQQGLFS